MLLYRIIILFNLQLYEGVILPEISKLASSSIDATMILLALSDIMQFIAMLAYLNRC